MYCSVIVIIKLSILLQYIVRTFGNFLISTEVSLELRDMFREQKALFLPISTFSMHFVACVLDR